MQSIEKPPMKAYQKRAAFKAYFSDILLERGFSFHKDRFVRFHEGQVLLNVSMELSASGAADIHFGAMPLCAADTDFSMTFGTKVCEFGRIYPLPENISELSFEKGQLLPQLELFQMHLLDNFDAIDSISSLLDYQERILEDRLGMLPADWAVLECIYLRDYEKARRYALIYESLLTESLENFRKEGMQRIIDSGYSRRDQANRLRIHNYHCKCLMQKVYEAQRILHMLDTGIYSILQKNIQCNIDAANAAFHKFYPNYR